MKRMMCVTFAWLLLGGAPLDADPQGHKHGPKSPAHETIAVDAGHTVELHFSAREIEVIRQYYAPRYRALPPGLQKKLRRTGHLPPGWEKRFEPFHAEVERELVVLPAGYRRGVIDGHAVIINPKTQVIIDVAVLF